MRRHHHLVAALVAALAAPAAAEVSVDRGQDGQVRLHFEPDAAGPWKRVRLGLSTDDVLEENGDLKGHGWPLAYDNPVSGLPEAAWTTGGEDADVVFARHDGMAWTATQRVSDGPGADQVPAIVLDGAGNRFLAWVRMRNGRYSAHFTALAGDDSGQAPIVDLSARTHAVRRPAIGVGPSDELYVVHEEAVNSNDATIDVAIDRVDVPRDGGGIVLCSGEVPIDVARAATFKTRLTRTSGAVTDPRVHRVAGRIYVSWIDSAALVGYASLSTGGFGPPLYVPYSGHDELEHVRDQIGKGMYQ